MLNVRSNKVRGFSLIELLITLVILAMLLSTATFAYQMLMNRWQKGLSQFDEAYQQYHQGELLQKVINGITPYVVVDSKSIPSFFFIGNETSLLAVTQNGLFSDVYPEVFRITAQENELGKTRLIYQSLSLNKILLVGTEQEVNFENEIVLADDLSEFNFRYLGWQDLSSIALSEITPELRWFDRYSGIDRQLIPYQLELTLSRGERNSVFLANYDKESFKELSPYFDGGDS